MDVLLVTLGTAGDVHPFVALGCELKKRQHRVTLVTNETFQPLAERVGLDFISLGTAEHYQSVLAEPDVWNPTRGFQILVREMIHGCMRLAYHTVADARKKNTLVISPCYLYGARIAAEKFSIPHVSVVLQPASIWSIEEPVSIQAFSWSRYFPKWIQRLLARGFGELVLERMLAPETNRFRREIGLPFAQKIATKWLYSPDSVVALFPQWFATPQSDWPPSLYMGGFISHEDRDQLDLSESCKQFIDAGSAPIVFTPGSGHCHASSFFATAVKACALLGERAIFLSGFHNHIPKKLPPAIRHFEYAPFDRVFPLCKAVVHHGGIGTTAKAIRAGVPQLIMPMAYDQPDNANRVQALGIGDFLRPKRFTADNVAEKLQVLLRSQQVQKQCQKLAADLCASDALIDACTEIERVGKYCKIIL